jgi:hypothetical protein
MPTVPIIEVMPTVPITAAIMEQSDIRSFHAVFGKRFDDVTDRLYGMLSILQ